MNKSLFDQLSTVERESLAVLLGCKEDSGLRNYLRDMPAIEGEFKLGDVVIAYCNFIINMVNDQTKDDSKLSQCPLHTQAADAVYHPLTYRR